MVWGSNEYHLGVSLVRRLYPRCCLGSVSRCAVGSWHFCKSGKTLSWNTQTMPRLRLFLRSGCLVKQQSLRGGVDWSQRFCRVHSQSWWLSAYSWFDMYGYWKSLHEWRGTDFLKFLNRSWWSDFFILSVWGNFWEKLLVFQKDNT